MQHHSSFNASYDMGLNLENRFCRLAVHCAPPPPSEIFFHTPGPFGLKFSGMSDPGEKRF